MRTIKNILTHEDAQKGVVMKDMEKVFEQIGKEIAEIKESTISREVAKKIGELLRDNGVVVNITECTCDDVTETSFSRKYGASITGLDFTEHDKMFADKIVELLKNNDNLVKMINELQLEKANIDSELHDAKQRIAELESKETETCEKEPIPDDCRPSIEWYENRHQSDCIEINRLNTTIDVLIHKVEYLRQFAGLE